MKTWKERISLEMHMNIFWKNLQMLPKRELFNSLHREVVRLLVNIIEPKEGMSICDPTCGSGGMLIESREYVKRHEGNPRDLLLEGQDSNYSTVGMCKMNMVLHNISDFKIEHGDIFTSPKLVEGKRLKRYHLFNYKKLKYQKISYYHNHQ